VIHILLGVNARDPWSLLSQETVEAQGCILVSSSLMVPRVLLFYEYGAANTPSNLESCYQVMLFKLVVADDSLDFVPRPFTRHHTSSTTTPLSSEANALESPED
jgi:hypothetical protein